MDEAKEVPVTALAHLSDDSIPPSLQRLFRAIIFDWDGTAVTDRREDAAPLVHLAEPLLDYGIWLVVVTGTNFGNIYRQFCRLVHEEHRSHLLVCANRGSEVYGFTAQGTPLRIWYHAASVEEDSMLDAAAARLRDALVTRTGLDIRIISGRMNRRKIDLIPLPEWADPPKAQIGELLRAVQARLHTAGQLGGLADVIDEARRIAPSVGLPEARITTDVKHIEIGLTDKRDALTWIKRELLAPEGIPLSDVLIVGDEFGTLAGFPGSDDRMRTDVDEAHILSVGNEPEGAPPNVTHLGGGPSRFGQLLSQQIARHKQVSHRVGTFTPVGVTTSDANMHDDSTTVQAWLQTVFHSAEESNWLLEAHTYVPALEHDIESRFTVSNGYLGIRGALDIPTRASRPRTFVAGLFASGEKTYFNLPLLAPMPDWMTIEVTIDGKQLTQNSAGIQWHRRFLDMQRGMLLTEWAQRLATNHLVRLRTLRLASSTTRNIAVHITQLALVSGTPPLEVTLRGAPHLRATSDENGAHSAVTPSERTIGEQISDGAYNLNNPLLLEVTGGKHVAALAGATASWVDDTPIPFTEGDSLTPVWMWQGWTDQWATFTRTLALTSGSSAEATRNQATVTLWRTSRELSTELLHSHVSAWAERWAASDITIEGDDEAQVALRFAMYHLISAADPTRDDVSIGARGLTGDAYLGHVFWDTDIFALPFYIFTWPDAARALLRYRYQTLPAARAKAARLGYRGALYAWESADTGDEVTPPQVRRPDGAVLRVLCGEEEHHISADIAFAVWSYWQATGDEQFLLETGAEILLETARFWASRSVIGADGQYHIYRVIGPDEYHESVDDNAYTNEMARWNLERGVETAALLAARWPTHGAELNERLHLSDAELASWATCARLLASPLTTADGVIEQFSGYFAREDIALTTRTPGGMPIDLLLGSDRVAGSQIVKQADVLMLLALLGTRYPTRIWEANFRYYAPRCVQGSSLSPAVHARIAACVGDLAAAEAYLNQAMQIDLSDTLGAAAQGIHMGALGGVWSAIVFGFLGLTFNDDSLRIDPRLLPSWRQLRVPVRWRNRHLIFQVTREPLTVQIRLEEGAPCTVMLRELHLKLNAQQMVQARSKDDGITWTEATP